MKTFQFSQKKNSVFTTVVRTATQTCIRRRDRTAGVYCHGSPEPNSQNPQLSDWLLRSPVWGRPDPHYTETHERERERERESGGRKAR